MGMEWDSHQNGCCLLWRPGWLVRLVIGRRAGEMEEAESLNHQIEQMHTLHMTSYRVQMTQTIDYP